LPQRGDRAIDGRHLHEFIRPMHDAVQLRGFLRPQTARSPDVKIGELVIGDPLVELALDDGEEMARGRA
jgi:hypothetical protein